MLEEVTQKQIVEQGSAKIRSVMNLCTNQIISCFESSIHSLKQMSRNRESQKDRIIDEQKETIAKLKRYVDFMDFMEDFTQQYEKFRKPFDDRKDSTVIPSLSQPKIPHSSQKPQNNSLRHIQETESMQNEKLEINGGKMSREQKSIDKPNQRFVDQKKLEPKKSGGHRRKTSKDEIKGEKKRTRIARKKENNKKKPGSDVIKEKPFENTQYKSPLQCRSSHPLCEVSYTPNFTRLKYVQYEHRRATAFDIQEIKILEKCDLSGVTSFALTSRQMNDEALVRFTKLELINLKSLRIESNLITDIRPLSNLNLKVIEDLDVSFNPLGIESAYFLAMQSFDSLIYFTVSFDTGLDEECWKVLLRNDMKNYPKLQALDVCNSNQLLSESKKQIVNCMARKSAIQMRQSRMEGFPNYPESYQIKISWNDSKQIFDTYPQEKQIEIGQNWQRSVHYDCKKLPRLPALALRLAAGVKCPGSRGKRKIIRKPKVQSEVRKPDLKDKKVTRNSESQSDGQEEDNDVKSLESDNQNESERDQSQEEN